jgi:microtubule-associated protein-like 6
MYELPLIDFADASNESNWNNNAEEDWKQCLQKVKYVFNKHSSAVIHIDFSADEKYWQSNCQAGELLFGNVSNGSQETSASKLADYNGQIEDETPDRVWHTQTCKLGWAVQGIWPLGMTDLSDINAVDKSGENNKYLATGDDNGMVKLFRFPCAKELSKSNMYSGHSSHVTNVRWTIANTLVSIGGNDKCLFVWNLNEK